MIRWLPLLCLGFAALARAGVRIETQVTSYDGVPVGTTLELQGESFRIDRNDAAGRTTIFDGEKMIVVSTKDKSYSAMTLGDLKARLAALPPEVRAQLDHAGASPTFSFKRGDGGDKIAGVACENYRIFKDGKETGIACLGLWKSSGPVTKTDLAPMKKLIDSMASMSKLSAGDLEIAEFDKWPGYPLLMRAPDGHELSRTTKITRVDFPPKEFQPPADYTSKSMLPMGPGRP